MGKLKGKLLIESTCVPKIGKIRKSKMWRIPTVFADMVNWCPQLESRGTSLEKFLYRNIRIHHAKQGCFGRVLTLSAMLVRPIQVYIIILKVKRNKMTSEVRAKCSRALCALYSRDTAIRISSVPRFRRKNPFVKISLCAKVMGAAKYFCRPSQYWIFQIWPYPRQNPM
jgi:hypothetical protein